MEVTTVKNIQLHLPAVIIFVLFCCLFFSTVRQQKTEDRAIVYWFKEITREDMLISHLGLLALPFFQKHKYLALEKCLHYQENMTITQEGESSILHLFDWCVWLVFGCLNLSLLYSMNRGILQVDTGQNRQEEEGYYMHIQVQCLVHNSLSINYSYYYF